MAKTTIHMSTKKIDNSRCSVASPFKIVRLITLLTEMEIKEKWGTLICHLYR
jgi:hypothetical protein